MNERTDSKKFQNDFRPSLCTRLGITWRYCSAKIRRFIFLYIHRPLMKPCPSQPFPGSGYLCHVCIYGKRTDYSVPRVCTNPQAYFDQEKKSYHHPGLVALTPGGVRFMLMRFYYDNKPEPNPVFGKDYTERCPCFIQDWTNDFYSCVDLSLEAHADYENELTKLDWSILEH
ncbi:MAG: hypothetical protein H8E87_08035 [FCB group bacterium]|nr:hypothetical protein [FCB group bacterium]